MRAMKKIKIRDLLFQPYICAEEIEEKIEEMATIINKDYENKKPLFLPILNGSFMFASDLFKKINIDSEISFIKLASYKGTSSSGNVITAIGLEETIYNRHIIILEDIIETGKTLHSFLPQLIHQQPASIKIATLLFKPTALKHDIEVNYKCFEIPNQFVVGYGLDFDGLGRNLPEIYQLID